MRVCGVLTRIYTANIENALGFYEELLGRKSDRRFQHAGLDLAVLLNP